MDDDVAQARAIEDLIQHYGWSHVMGLYSDGKECILFRMESFDF